MNNLKTRAFIVLVFLALGSAWLLPGVAGQGIEMSLVQRVAVLEELVLALSERVEALENGQGSKGNAFDVIHLNPQSNFPSDPSDGDLCVVGNSGDRHLYCYLNGDWRRSDSPTKKTSRISRTLGTPTKVMAIFRIDTSRTSGARTLA